MQINCAKVINIYTSISAFCTIYIDAFVRAKQNVLKKD